MKIKVSEMWENIGTVFENSEDLYSELSEKEKELGREPFIVLKKGTYLIVNKDQYGYDLYEINTGKNVFFEGDWVEDKEFNIYITPPNEILDLMIEALNKKIIQLSAEGWEPNKEYFDLNPYLGMLDSLVKTREILNGIKNT